MKTNSSLHWPRIMLIARLIMFIGIQVIFALGFLWAGNNAPWESAANWWPFAVTITNLVCIVILVRLYAQGGERFWDVFRIQTDHIKTDLLALLGILIILGPVSYLPNVLLGKLLFDDPQHTLEFLVRPLPLWAAYASIILFPVTQGLAELATYFAYVMPKLQNQGMKPWMAVTLPVLFLAFQHIGVPLLFNPRYLLWRGLMFLPFAFLAGIVMRWRPRLLPYLASIHVLMDLSFAVMLLETAW